MAAVTSHKNLVIGIFFFENLATVGQFFHEDLC
jgi:hypothetical protein